MSASATVIANTKTVISNGPNAATLAKAIAAAGPIQDYLGNVNGLLLRFASVATQLAALKSVTDSGDSANLALINKLLAAMNGTSTPSTTYIADATTVFTNGPGATTKANAIAAAGPIMDYLGNVALVITKLQEAAVLLDAIIAVTDSTDSTNLTLLNSIDAGLV